MRIRSNKITITMKVAKQSVARQWSEVTRPSADCQTTFLTFQAIRKFLKKSPNGHATVVGGHATVDRLSNNFSRRFKQMGKIRKSRWTVTRHSSEVTRPSTDCQTTFFHVSSISKFFSKKSRNNHATEVGGHATVGQLSNNFLRRFKQFGKISQTKSLNGHATVVGGHATVGWLPNNCISTSQQKWQNFEKSRGTLTRQSSEVPRSSSDSQTKRSRDSRRGSRDRRQTVKQLYFDVSAKMAKLWKKSRNGHVTVVGRSRYRRLTVKQFQWCCYLAGWILHQYACNSVPNPLNIALALLCIRMHNQSIVGQSLEGHATVAWLSSTISVVIIITLTLLYIWIRERVSSVTLHTGAAMLRRRPFH